MIYEKYCLKSKTDHSGLLLWSLHIFKSEITQRALVGALQFQEADSNQSTVHHHGNLCSSAD